MLQLDERYQFRGQRIAWGKLGSGPPLVFVHGTPFSSQVWRRIAPHFAKSHSVYFFDLAGYGQSEMRDGQDVSLGVQNHLLMAMLAHWQADTPEIVAHDFGGATALRAIYLNGLSPKRLTLIDPVALAPWGSPFVQHVRKHEEAFAFLPDYAHRALLRAYLQGASARPLPDDVIAIHANPWIGDVGQKAFYRQIAQMDQRYTDEIEPLYEPRSFPVQLLWGEDDDWIPVETGERLARRLGIDRLTRIRDCGHLMQEDAPEAIVAAVLDWL